MDDEHLLKLNDVEIRFGGNYPGLTKGQWLPANVAIYSGNLKYPYLRGSGFDRPTIIHKDKDVFHYKVTTDTGEDVTAIRVSGDEDGGGAHTGNLDFGDFDSFMASDKIAECRKPSMFGSVKTSFDRTRRYDLVKTEKNGDMVVVLSINFKTGSEVKEFDYFCSNKGISRITECLTRTSGGKRRQTKKRRVKKAKRKTRTRKHKSKGRRRNRRTKKRSSLKRRRRGRPGVARGDVVSPTHSKSPPVIHYRTTRTSRRARIKHRDAKPSKKYRSKKGQFGYIKY